MNRTRTGNPKIHCRCGIEIIMHRSERKCKCGNIVELKQETYNVSFAYEESGNVDIKAVSWQEAVKKLEQQLEDEGLPEEFEVTGRDITVLPF